MSRFVTARLLAMFAAVAAAALTAAAEDFAGMRGANYVPSYARNDVQIWMGFDPAVIHRELGYAERLKLNTVRVFLQYAVYERDPKQFLDRFDHFLSLCEKHRIQMMPVLFDSCFGEFPDLENDRDKDWMANPGQNRLGREHWPKLEQYVRDVVGGHQEDQRIVMWDVMNEPWVTSFNKPEDQRLIQVFLDHFLDYVGQQDANHPRTVGFEHSSLMSRAIDKTEVLCFHNYRQDLREDIRTAQALARRHGKPVIINEAVGRPRQPFPWVMPILREEKIGWCFWELMLGKTQFARDPVLPYQGLIYPDGTCFDAEEVAAVMDTSVVEARKLFPPRRWTTEQAWQWYKQEPWLVGFNYVPSSAANTTEWWQAETFDPAVIDRELGWAGELGLNSARCFIQYLVWKHDPDGLKDRFRRFLEIAQRHGISVMPVLFDDCAFGDPPQTEPYLGKQREPIPGMILPSWTPSPGLSAVTDRSAWPDLERYVKDMVGTFRDDRRVVMWDLYNEPGNSAMGNKSLPLVEAAFTWARQANPSQPLTVGVWSAGLADLNRVATTRSDVITYHAYTDCDGMRAAIAGHKSHGRPVVCTEWMARPRGSRMATDLPLLKRAAVGCYMWGLINGRTQAQFPWWNKPNGTVDAAGWFHDILHADGRAYRPEEIEVIRKLAARKSRMDGKQMMFADRSRGRPFAKDPDVVRYGDRYWMYYSMGPDDQKRWAMGIASSDDLTNWEKVGEILPEESYEQRGLVAGAAIVLDGKIHLFYSTYGNGANDAICHAWSVDGLKFHRDPSNPVFRPTGDWTSGRAIDADVVEHDERLLLLCATRDPSGTTQFLVGAEALRNSDFGRSAWRQFPGGAVLRPELPWEKHCVEAPSIGKHGGKLYLFYAGAYNNEPQQIGVAVSEDGRHWKRLSRSPLLPNGAADEWNASESGHPGVLVDDDGESYLFFQGNNDRGKTWYLSKMSIEWESDRPHLVRYWDGREFHLRPFGEIADTDAAVHYSNGWTLWRGEGPRDGTLHYANQAGSVAELSFEGTGVHLVHKVGPDCGMAEILIDGKPSVVPHLDTYGSQVEWNRRTPVAQGLEKGKHTVMVKVTGEKHADSSNTYVQIVGFDVRE